MSDVLSDLEDELEQTTVTLINMKAEKGREWDGVERRSKARRESKA